MKKLIAILLLAVYLFNLFGYSLVFRYLSYQTDKQFVQALDQRHYNESDLVEISIPLHLPYMQSSRVFERIDGSIENKGVQYNYVKRRVFNDTLHIMCIPNQQKTALAKEKTRVAGEVNDFDNSKKGKEPAAKKFSATAEYSNEMTQYSFTFTVPALQTNEGLATALCSTAFERPEHPPQTGC